ncbi:hypothetical protein BKA61DRAFT_499062, partial [Leptodontidium sp. MPI-SDFR-AT-0119]
KLKEQVIETRKKKLEADYLNTLANMNSLAPTYREQGRAAEAEKLNVEVIEICKKKLGTDHPDTLFSLNNLAFI